MEIKEALPAVKALRAELHAMPELSLKEEKTNEALKTFLYSHTHCEIHEEDGWFYAVHREGDDLPTIAIRGDVDAIPGADGAFHGCGHDGHAATAAGCAMVLDGKKIGRNVVFLFQPGEEIGAGAKLCRSALAREHVSAVFGYHSIPGHPKGKVLTRRDVFACASRGMIIKFEGLQCHAAYPETGHNPAFLISDLIGALPTLIKDPANRGMVLATVVAVQVGSHAFGVSAGQGELCLTVRAHYEEDLERLIAGITDYAGRDKDIRTTVEFIDVFPDTVNDGETELRAEQLMDENGIAHEMLSEPLRWSEDFGWYLKECKGAFFGIGDGEDYPALHTPEFEYPDDILETAMGLLVMLAEQY